MSPADQKIVRLDPAGRHLASQAGFEWQLGDVAAPAALQAVADSMADSLIAAVSATPLPHAIEHLYLTDPLADFGAIDAVMFSGGVGEYVYGRESRDFGDLGRLLGSALRKRIDAGALPWPMLPAGECIRATALGASEYSAQRQHLAMQIATPAVLSAEQITVINRNLWKPHLLQKVWDYHMGKLTR